MTTFNYSLDAKLSKGVYTSFNQTNTAIIDEWKPVKVRLEIGEEFSPTFAAQLYEKNGQYKLAFRGTEGNLADWAQNGKYGLNAWSDEFGDVARFTGRAIQQIAFDKGISNAAAAQILMTTGHSQGGFEAELAAVLYGLKGTSLDGMGSTGIVNVWRAKLSQIMSDTGMTDFAVERNLTAQDFGTRIYTLVGRLGIHAGGTEVSLHAGLAVAAVLANPVLAFGVVTVGLTAHPIGGIISWEVMRDTQPTWLRFLTDGSDGNLSNTPTALALQTSSDWAVQVASLGTTLPASLVTGMVRQFYDDHLFQDVELFKNGKDLLLRSKLNGDQLFVLADGSGISTKQNGIANVSTEFGPGNVVRNTTTVLPDDNGNTLVTKTGAGYEVSFVMTSAQKMDGINGKWFNASNQITSTWTQALSPDGSTVTQVSSPAGTLLSTTRNQSFDEANGQSALETITDHTNGREYVVAIVDGVRSAPQELVTSATQNWANKNDAAKTQTLTDSLYSGATDFFNALRTSDKLGQLLAIGKIASDYSRLNNLNANGTGAATQFDSFLTGASASLGILSALNGLQSGDLKTQLNSVANLLRSADTLATMNGSSFLTTGASQALSQFGAVLSIANMGNVGQMLENGQLGSAIATTVNAINAGAFLASTATGGSLTAFGSGAFIPMDPTTLLLFVVGTAILDEVFKKTPPPPPPVGQATLKTLANGSVGYDISNAANGGAELLTEKMNALVAQINAQLDYANGKVLTQAQQTLLELTPAQVAALPSRPIPAADQMLTLVASRAPKIFIQSWPAHAPANLNTNYFYGLEAKHPQTGQSYNVGLARQDLVRHYAEALVHPQALVAQWEVTHLTAKYGSNQTLWKTEGQWASGLSAIEAERLTKQAAITAAQGALANAQKTTLTQGAFVGEGEITGNIFVQSPPDAVSQTLDAVQTEGVARFDVDNDGYREATEWLAPSEAILGLDRDNNGALDTANELFNGVNTPFAGAGCSRREPAKCKRSRQSKVGKSCQLSKTKQSHKYKRVFVHI